MVIGLNLFREHFAPYADQYVLIGGTACTVIMQESGLDFRATKDLDIVLYVEALNTNFVSAFWKFIEEGRYQNQQRSSGKEVFYRFASPAASGYPSMLELFSRIPDNVKFSGKGHLTPIPVNDAVASLSAILLDDNYYNFIHLGKRQINDLSVLDAVHLIPLKARAYLDLMDRKKNGENIDEKDIRKHKNDVIRLYQLLSPNSRKELPQSIKNDMSSFLNDIKNNKSIDCRNLGLKNTDTHKIAEILGTIYGISLNYSAADNVPNIEHILSKDKSISSRQPLSTISQPLAAIIADGKGADLVEAVEKAIASGADVNDDSRNGNKPLQLLIRARLELRLKIRLINLLIEKGANINSPDNSGLSPFQVAVSEGDKEIADLLASQGARKLAPPGTGYAKYYNMYLQLPPN